MKDENIFQILCEGQMGLTLQSWHESEEEAEAELKNCKEYWPEHDFWISKGTDCIFTKCKGCGTVHANECFDAYGIPTGHWCDECYDSPKYPYKKNRYDYAAYGERLEDDY